MSHLSNIGFIIETNEDYIKLVETLGPLTQAMGAKDGVYFCFSDPSGAQLWIQGNEEGEAIGANPHFYGQSKFKVSITECKTHPDNIMDGGFMAQSEEGGYPFMFDVPNHNAMPIEGGVVAEVQLSAFAHNIAYFSDETAYNAQQNDEMKMAAQSFIPTGLFPNEGDDMPKSMCMFTGIVKDTKQCINDFTKKPFQYLLVQTLGGEIDVVADTDAFTTPPKIGGVVQGDFWLSGLIVG